MKARILPRSSTRGVVSIEMLLAFFPVLVTFLGVIQLALLFMGKLVVAHAAQRAVRSAVVILDDDPEYYDDAPRGDLESGAIPVEGSFAEFWGDLNVAYEDILGREPPKGGARLGAIRSAAYHPLAVLAPASLVSAHTSLRDELGGPALGRGKKRVTLPELRIGLFALAYNRAASSITVHTEPDGPAVTQVSPGGTVTVQVSYLMKCGVPLVGALLCQNGKDLARASLGLDTNEKAVDTLTQIVDVASPILRDTMLVGGAHYQLLSARATLPNQAAEYHEDE